jgi:hypothetical protein
VKKIRKEVDIEITNNLMPKMTGVKPFTHLIHAWFYMKNVAMISWYCSAENLKLVRASGIQTFTKPISAAMLMEWLETREVGVARD